MILMYVCNFFRFFTSAESAKHGKDALAQKLDKDLKTTRDGEASDILEPPEKASRAEAAAPCRSKSSSSSFMKEFDKIREEREEPGGAASCSSTAVQMHGFFTEETIPVTHDPYKYWGVNHQRFPGLAVAALSYLCAPCTSVESERIFSTVSWILDEKRNRLTADRAEMLSFLCKNLPVMLKTEIDMLNC